MADELVKLDDVLAVLGRNWRSTNDANDAIQQSIFDIGNLPALHRPVVRGQWERPKTINGRVKCVICSACGIGQVFRTSFCPNCGADMRQD